MTSVVINVEQKHIDNGVIGACSSCPIALAVHEQLGAHYDIRELLVGQLSVHFGHYPHRKHCGMSAEAKEFISNFDAERLVQPFSFTLEIPDAA